MTEAMVYDAYLETQASGACLALIYDLPGCFARGVGEDDTLERLTANIPTYFAWLREHDEYTPTVAGPFGVQLQERQRTAEGDAYANSVFFTPDGDPVNSEDLDWLLALLGWAYADLRDIVLAQEAALQRADAASQTPLQWLTHLMTAQQWLFSLLAATPAPEPPVTPPTPAAIHDWLTNTVPAQITRFQSTDEGTRRQIIERDGVRWSLRKVLTRSILLGRDYERLLSEAFGVR